MKKLILFLCLMGQMSFAAETAKDDLNSDFDSLGGNKILLERAKALEPDMKVSIVQERTVSRRNRVEIAPEFSGTFGGDTYTRTRNLGLNLQYHFTPRWSAGVKYNYSFNTLTPEGEAMIDKAYSDYQKNPGKPDTAYPQMDFPKSEMLALVNWYPIYGKMNLLDQGIAHFDCYLVGGYGTVELSSGPTSTYTGGAGMGFWFNQHFSSRFEMRYQNYKAKYLDGDKNLDLAVASVQMGWML
jgi:outer membrane beta-barrel protein